jgi:hypothetical protein
VIVGEHGVVVFCLDRQMELNIGLVQYVKHYDYIMIETHNLAMVLNIGVA